jgi:hypothetical protein
MVKHIWEDYRPNDIMKQMSAYGHRRCKLCGATQDLNSQTLWMRVKGYRWEPKVGRCKGTNSGIIKKL